MADDGRTGQDDRNRTDGNPLKEETEGGREEDFLREVEMGRVGRRGRASTCPHFTKSGKL